MTITRSIPLIWAFAAVANAQISPADLAYVPCSVDNSVSVINLKTQKVITTIPVGKGPDWMTFTPDGTRVYVSNAGSDSVSVLDAASKKELTKIAVGKVPKRIIAVEVP